MFFQTLFLKNRVLVCISIYVCICNCNYKCLFFGCFIDDRCKITILYYVTKIIPGRKEQLQRKLKRCAKICVGLGGYFLKYTKKTVVPQEEIELLEQNEDDSTIPRQSSPPKISDNVLDMRGYTANK